MNKCSSDFLFVYKIEANLRFDNALGAFLGDLSGGEVAHERTHELEQN